MILHSIIPKAFDRFHHGHISFKRHLKNNFYPSFMTRLNHILQRDHTISVCRIGTFRRKIISFSVPPIIRHSSALLKFIHRHTMDLINSKLFQIGKLLYDSLKGSFCRNLRIRIFRKSSDMKIISNHITIGMRRQFVVLPVISFRFQNPSDLVSILFLRFPPHATPCQPSDIWIDFDFSINLIIILIICSIQFRQGNRMYLSQYSLHVIADTWAHFTCPI